MGKTTLLFGIRANLLFLPMSTDICETGNSERLTTLIGYGPSREVNSGQITLMFSFYSGNKSQR